MNNKISVLGALLVAQVTLTVAVFVMPVAEDGSSSQLLTFSAANIDRVTVSDGSNNVELINSQESWQVAGVPADGEKVINIIDKLATIDAPWPVSTSSGSMARFEVTEEDYQRQVRLYADGSEVAAIYLGTSPGYQRVHARRGDSNEVYSVALSNYEIGTEIDDWLDKTVLAMTVAPTSIELRLLDAEGVEERAEVFEFLEGGWLHNGAAAEQEGAINYANRFSNLRVLGLADMPIDSDQSFDEWAKLVASNENEQRHLVIVRQGEDDYSVMEEGGEFRYRLAAYTAEQLLMKGDDFPQQKLPTDNNQ